MSSNAEAEPSSAPTSFNNFSFSFTKRSLLQRMGGQVNPPPAPDQNSDSTPTAPSNTSSPLPVDSSLPNTSPTSVANSLSVSHPDASSPQSNGFVLQSPNPNPDEPNLQPPSHSQSPSHIAMEIDEPTGPEILEGSVAQTTLNGSRVPEAYRSLPATHYFVAPPAALPYPRSPVRRFPEGHPLHTQPSMFAHLPRAPPRSPRLDPLAVLELESERERSEWEQVCKDLGRPGLEASPATRSLLVSSEAPPTSSLPNPTSLPQTRAEVPKDPISVAPSEETYDSDSSDVELRIYNADREDETQAPSDLTAGATRHTLVPLGARPLNANGQVAATTSRIATGSSSPGRLFPKASTPVHPSAFAAGGSGPAAPSGDQRSKSPQSNTTTPAKRKFDTIDQPAQESPNNETSSTTQNTVVAERLQERTGVPPPLRAGIDRIPVSQSGPATPPAPSNPASEQAASRSSSILVSRSEKPSATSQPNSNTTTPLTSTAADPGARKICKYHNRPPGRVCVRKESCPDLHQGPLQTSVSPFAYFLSTTSTPTAPLTPSESPGPPVETPSTATTPMAIAAPPAVVATPPAAAAIPPAAAAIPPVVVTPSPVTVAPTPATVAAPPVTVATSTATVAAPPATAAAAPATVAPTPATVAAPSATVAPPPTEAPSTAKTTAPVPRPPSRTERREPPRCKYDMKPSGCTRKKCPFKHVPKDQAGSGSTTENRANPASSSQMARAGTSGTQKAPSSAQVSVQGPRSQRAPVTQTNGPVARTQQGAPILSHPLPAKPTVLPPSPTSQAPHAAGTQPPGKLPRASSNVEAGPPPPSQAGASSQPTKKKSISPSVANIKTERPSPGPKLSQRLSPPQPKARPVTQAAPISREIKQEDVTLYDLADDRGEVDEEMADNVAEAPPHAGTVLPPSLTAPAQSLRAPAPRVAPPVGQPKTSATSLPPNQVQFSSSQAPARSVPATAPPVPATAVIPPTPARPPQNAAPEASTAPLANRLSIPIPSRNKPPPPMPTRPNLPPVPQSFQSPEQPREPIRSNPERPELLSRLQDRPPVQQRRNGSETYRPAYDDQPRPRRSPSRSQSPPRTRRQSPGVRTRSPSPTWGRNVGTAQYREYSPIGRSRSPARLYDRFGASDLQSGRPDLRRSPSHSRSPSPGWYRNHGGEPRAWHWSPPPSRSRSRSPPPRPAPYRRPSYDDREYGYHPTTAPPPRSRSPSPRRNLGSRTQDGYTNGSAYFPPEMNIPRPWEVAAGRPSGGSSVSRPGESAGVSGNTQVERYPHAYTNIPTITENTSRPTGSGTGVGPPLRSSTPGGARQPSPYASGPMAALNDYDSFDYTRTMEMSSPSPPPMPQHRHQDRLQDRIHIPPGQPPPPNRNAAPLLARMGNEPEQPPLAGRIDSNRGPPPAKAPQRAPTASGSRAQLASRLGVGSGEWAPPPLAHRLAGERDPHLDYQARMEPMNAPPRNSDRRGGTLMARMVGEKK